MGCWNETCRLSNLPILSGNEITVVLLVENNDETGVFSCHYNDKYVPLCLPIVGEYNDYGGIENAKVSECTMKLLNSLKIVWENDEAYNITTIEDFVDDITSSKLYLKRSPISEKCKIECVFYHKKLYDTLVEEISKQTPYNSDTSFFKLYTKEFENIVSNYSKNKYEDKYSLNKAYNDVFRTSSYGHSFVKEAIVLLFDVNEMKEFHKELVSYIMFANALIIGRYGFGITSGAGSQDNCVFVQRTVAKFILEFTENNERYDLKNGFYW